MSLIKINASTICDGGVILLFRFVVNSEVLSAALGESFLEGRTNRISMMFSAEVVMALLKHQYYRNLDAAAESFSVTIELLRVSEYYDIQGLWNDLVSVILASDSDWFQLPQVFEAFHFVAKSSMRYTPATELIEKLMNVLVM